MGLGRANQSALLQHSIAMLLKNLFITLALVMELFSTLKEKKACTGLRSNLFKKLRP